VHQHKLNLSIVGHFPIPSTSDENVRPPEILQDDFDRLPHAIRRICCSVKCPSDDGASILHSIQQSSCPALYSSSDAALKSQCSTHAWIISSGQVDDIMDSEQNISGAGPVDGLSPYLSSSRAELTGLNALVIIANLFMDFHHTKTTFPASCDHQGMIKKCSSNPSHRLCIHREANNDLFLVQRFYSNRIKAQFNWVKGHTDKEPWETLQQLKTQKLSTEEMFNVWCDRMASNEWKNGTHSVFDPDVSPRNDGVFIQIILLITYYLAICPLMLPMHCHGNPLLLTFTKNMGCHQANCNMSIQPPYNNTSYQSIS
jgi:hypothetical protein